MVSIYNFIIGPQNFLRPTLRNTALDQVILHFCQNTLSHHRICQKLADIQNFMQI